MTTYKKLQERRNKDDEATALAFQEFIETFQVSAPAGKTFLKSGIYNPGGSEDHDGKVSVYNPPLLIKSPLLETNKKAMECARILKDSKYSTKGKSSSKPKSNLELLKEEIQMRQMDREGNKKTSSHASNQIHPGGESSVSAPSLSSPAMTIDQMDSTTNLFITNLNPKFNEQDLMHIFGVYGPLASVKIMWPRLTDRHRDTNIGFVAFMSRKDSERAYTCLNNRTDMKLTWGKPVDIPNQPVFIPPQLMKTLLPPPQSGLPFNAQPRRKKCFKYESDEDFERVLHESNVRVSLMLEKKIMFVINRTIEFVLREGPIFEAILMHREFNNPNYQFLFDNRSPTHVYYRWKLFSILNGESAFNWSTKPFRMFQGGSVWIPPTIPDYTQGMPDVEPEKCEESLLYLSEQQQTNLINLLRKLNPSRKMIAEAMSFCVRHYEASRDVVEIIVEAFENVETKLDKKIARLYLVSDILYNSRFKKTKNLPKSYKTFREFFQEKLADVFRNLDAALKYHCEEENLCQGFQLRIDKVLKAWEVWHIFSNEFLDKLRSLAEINCNEDESENEEIPLDGKLLVSRGQQNYSDCIVQQKVQQIEVTKTKNSTDQQQKSSTNSAKNNFEEDISSASNFTRSQWRTLDPEETETQAMSTQKLHAMELARLEKLEEDRVRKIEFLREIEMKVIRFQDSLENGERRLKHGATIEEELFVYRQKLIEKLSRRGFCLESHERSRAKKKRRY